VDGSVQIGWYLLSPGVIHGWYIWVSEEFQGCAVVILWGCCWHGYCREWFLIGVFCNVGFLNLHGAADDISQRLNISCVDLVGVDGLRSDCPRVVSNFFHEFVEEVRLSVSTAIGGARL